MNQKSFAAAGLVVICLALIFALTKNRDETGTDEHAEPKVEDKLTVADTSARSTKAQSIASSEIEAPLSENDSAQSAIHDSLIISALEAVCDPAFQAKIAADGKPWDGGGDIDYAALLRETSATLAASTDPDQLVAAALTAIEPDKQIEAITRAVREAPADSFVLWTAVNLCLEQGSSPRCPLDDWMGQLLEVDSQNSQSWATAAAHYHQQGRTGDALNALKQATGSSETRAYWLESIVALRRGFAAGSDMPIEMRTASAFDRAATLPIPEPAVYYMCEEMSAMDAEWATLCLQYGELAERQSISMMTQGIARGTQRVAATALGDTATIDAIDQRAREAENTRSGMSDASVMAGDLIMLDDAIFSAYIAAIRDQGELGAQRTIGTAVEDIWEDNPELRCPL